MTTTDHKTDLEALAELGQFPTHCSYCGEPLSEIKGGSHANGLHYACNISLAEEMDRVFGPIEHITD